MLIALRILSAIVFPFLGWWFTFILILMIFSYELTIKNSVEVASFCFIIAISFGYLGFYINTYWKMLAGHSI